MRSSHYDVILSLVREYQSLNGIQIEYRDFPPTALEFSRILRSNRPVVFKGRNSFFIAYPLGAIIDWPAMKMWSNPEYLREILGDQIISVAETPNGYICRKWTYR